MSKGVVVMSHIKDPVMVTNVGNGNSLWGILIQEAFQQIFAIIWKRFAWNWQDQSFPIYIFIQNTSPKFFVGLSAEWQNTAEQVEIQSDTKSPYV